MNSRHLKALRKALQFHPSQPREYLTRNVKTVAVPTGRVDEKGNAIMRYEVRSVTTSTGLRRSYQRAKKHIAKGFL